MSLHFRLMESLKLVKNWLISRLGYEESNFKTLLSFVLKAMYVLYRMLKILTCMNIWIVFASLEISKYFLTNIRACEISMLFVHPWQTHAKMTKATFPVICL